MAAHNGKVCVKTILQLDAAIAVTPIGHIQVSPGYWASAPACHTEMVNVGQSLVKVLLASLRL